MLKSVNNILDQHRRTRHLRNSTARRLLQRAKSNGANVRNLVVQSGEKPSTVRKFVLPVRSVHSSRVIKPNKRFIEELEEISTTEHSENEFLAHIKKIKLNSDKFGNQESKLKVRETRGKSKKLIRVDLNDADCIALAQRAKDSEGSASSVQNAQISKPHRELKKSYTVTCKNKISNGTSNICNNGVNQECSQSAGKAAQTAKSTVPRNPRQISVIPTKALPESNVPNYESSRVQTRSGAQTEIAGDSSESGAGSTEGGCASTKVQSENANNNKGTLMVGASSSLETEPNLSESENEHHGNHSENEQLEFSSGMKINGKVILRKARLKLDNKCLAGTEGPFSTTSNSNTVGGNTSLGTVSLCAFTFFVRVQNLYARIRFTFATLFVL